MFKKWLKTSPWFVIVLSLIIVLLSGLPGIVSAAGPWTVSSPDGTIVVTVQENSGTISYGVTKNSTVIFENSTLGINTSVADFTSGLTFSSSSTNTINEQYSLPGHKKATYTNTANELTLKFTKSSQEMDLIVRASNDGAAFRYYVPGSGSINVTSENSYYNLPDSSTGWALSYTNSYEGFYPPRSNFNSGNYCMPVLVKYNDTTWAVLSASDIAGNYHACSLTGGSGANMKVTWPTTTSVTGTRPFNTPWRLAMIGSLGTIFESTMVENLSSPPMFTDYSWIKTGRSAWSWWSGDSTSDYNTQVGYVNFASSMGWEFYLCDAGWQASWAPTLITYAASKGVGILLWEDVANLNTAAKIQTAFSLWSGWGAKGVKVDYFYNDNQATMKIYDLIAQYAAQYHLTVNYHGATIPNGLERRWPNVLTQEGVYGAEQYGGTGPSAAHNITLCFTRNAVGPMDYTPVTYSNNRGQTTWAHQSALPVIFSSYVTHMADRWTTYDTSVAKEFLRVVPAIWDESHLLEGYPDQYITIARRNGTDWYVGSICGSGISRTATIPLTFLGGGSYTACIYKDGSSDSDIVYTQQTVTSASILSIPLRANGGCAIRLISGTLPTPTPSPTPVPGGNDEFNSSTLNPMWSWVRQNSANWSLTAYSGYMRIITEQGDIYAGTNTTKNILLQTPTTSDFSITTKLTFNATQSYQQAGIIVYANDDNYISICRKYGSSKVFSLIKEVSATPTEQTAVDSLGGTVYLKITKTGTSYYGYYSSDGSTWTQAGSTITGVSLTSPKVGLVAANGGSSGAPSINADFDYFRYAGTATPTPTPTPGSTATPTPTPTPGNTATPTPSSTPTPTPVPGGNDEFNLTTLNGMWSWVRQNSANWSLSANPGYMRIITEQGDIYAGSNTTKNILLQTPSTSDFSITTKLTFTATQSFQQAGIIVYASDDNYISLCRKYGSSKVFSLVKEVSAAATEQTATDSLSGTVYLKITKSGTSYTGYYSSNGTTWTQVGSTITGVSLTSPKVGLIACNGSTTVTSITADYDWFHF